MSVDRRIRSTAVSTLSSARGSTLVCFSLAGPLYVVVSPTFTPHWATKPVLVSIELGTTGTTNTVVALVKNGVSMGSLTLTSGVRYTDDVGAIFSAFSFRAKIDYAAMSILTVGTGAADMTMQVDWA